ncbi:MAG: ABC transporter permease subunit [Verrucomicrobia bacterium]|nr:ABC transporter permease subunit [Verrucomicrobiota bacterium]
MTFLPIVARELRVAARRRGTYWTRVIAALISICAAGWMLTFSQFGRQPSPSELSRNIFMTLSTFAFIYCLVAGARNTADCLSEEKREGTLGLLFLTDLKGYDVVLGKLAATSLNSFYGLLGIFPVLAIPLLLGGVAGVQFWRMVLVLANTLFLSLAAGMWVSSLVRNERNAVGNTVILILFITGGIPLGGALFDQYVLKWQGEPVYALLPSPAYAFYLASAASFLPSLDPNFWWSLLATHSLSWGLLALASARLPHAWQDNPATVARLRWRERWKQWSYGGPAERKAFRERLMNVNPFFWLAGRDRLKPTYVWAFLGLSAVVWLWGLAELKNDWLEEVTYVMTALFLHSVLKIWVATEACQRLNHDRQSGALELLLSTPLSVSEILRGQLLALRRQFLGPILIVLLADFLFLINLKYESTRTLVFLAGMGMLVADVYTLSWVGMWLGLKAKDANRATGSAVARILILPWVLFYVGGMFLEALQFSTRRFNIQTETTILVWFALGIFINLIFFTRANQGLRRHLRSLATERFEPAQRHVRWWKFRSRRNVSPAPPVITS